VSSVFRAASFKICCFLHSEEILTLAGTNGSIPFQPNDPLYAQKFPSQLLPYWQDISKTQRPAVIQRDTTLSLALKQSDAQMIRIYIFDNFM
jgi:hypothetical protein